MACRCRVIHSPRGATVSDRVMLKVSGDACSPQGVVTGNTSHMSNTSRNRCYTGVSLEPEVIDYLNDLAGRMGMSRSWALNTIVHEYAKIVEARQLKPLSSRSTLIHS